MKTFASLHDSALTSKRIDLSDVTFEASSATPPSIVFPPPGVKVPKVPSEDPNFVQLSKQGYPPPPPAPPMPLSPFPPYFLSYCKI
jgi:hypothetical protein